MRTGIATKILGVLASLVIIAAVASMFNSLITFIDKGGMVRSGIFINTVVVVIPIGVGVLACLALRWIWVRLINRKS